MAPLNFHAVWVRASVPRGCEDLACARKRLCFANCAAEQDTEVGVGLSCATAQLCCAGR